MRMWLVILLFIPVSVLYASDLASDRYLTLEQAIIQVLEKNPLLRATDFEAKAAAARIRSAQLAPGFNASIELENFAGSGNNNGVDNIETTLSLSKVLEFGDKAQARANVARQQALVLGRSQDAQRLDLLAEATRKFIAIIAQQERLKVVRESLKLAQRTKKIITRRVNAGRSPKAVLSRASISFTHKELDVKHVEHLLKISRLKLSSLWGDTIPNFNTARGNLYRTSPLRPFNVLAQQLVKNPDLALLVNKQRLADTRVQLAKSKRAMDIELVGGVRHFNASGDAAFVLSLNIPLGTSARAQASVEEVQLMQQRSPYLFKQRLLSLHTVLFELHQEIQHSIELVDKLRNKIIPLARSSLRGYEKGYAAGRYSYLELTEAQRTLLGARIEVIVAATNYHRYRIEMDRLIGTDLSTGVKP